MTRFHCKGNMREGVTVFTVQLESRLAVIRNAPCLECDRCGETENGS